VAVAAACRIRQNAEMSEETAPVPTDFDAGREELLKQTAAPPAKKKRWILRIAIATPVALALLVLMGPTLLSTGPIRGKIETAAHDATSRRVTIEDHSLGWWAPAELENFVMYEKDGTTPFLKIARLSVKVDIKPLLDSDVILRTCEISGVEMRIVRRRDGTLSTDDIGPVKPKEKAGDEGTIVMGTVEIRDVAVTFIDEAAGETYRVKGMTVNAKPGATPEEIVAEISAKVQVGSASPGDLDVKATVLALSAGKLRKEITAEATVAFKGIDVAAMMPMQGVEWATGAVAGTLKAKLLAGGDVEAALDAKVPFFKWGDPGALPQVATPVDFKQDISWRRKDGRIDLKPGGRIQMNGCDVQAQGFLAADGPVDLVVKFDGDLTKLREVFPASLADQDMKGPLRTFWNVKGANFDRLEITGKATVTSPPLPTDYSWKIRGKEYVIPNPGNLSVELKGTYDGARRKLRAAEPGRPWASLDGLAFDVTVQTPWVRAEAMEVKRIMIDLSLREQACDLCRIDFRLNDGDVKCTGKIEFDAEDPAWNLHTTVGDPPVKYSSQFSGLAALLNPALYSDQQGQVDAAMAWDISLRGRGFDMKALKKTLEGEGKLGLRNVTLAGSPLFTELYSMLQLTKQTKFEYSLVDQKFHIKDGKVYNEFSKFQGDSKEADITISGETDFDGNMKQTITVAGDPTARWGKRTGAVVEVFNKSGGLPLGGTAADPKIDIDFEKALEGAVKGILDNPDVKEKVDDLLDDLFKKKKKKK